MVTFTKIIYPSNTVMPFLQDVLVTCYLHKWEVCKPEWLDLCQAENNELRSSIQKAISEGMKYWKGSARRSY